LYITDSGSGTVKELPSGAGSTTNLVSGLSDPTGVAVDIAGNLYIAGAGNKKIYEWMPAGTNLTTLVSSGLSSPDGVAVDGAGNVYIADSANNTIVKWTAASNSASILLSAGLKEPTGVAVDSAGNVYIANSGSNMVQELPYAFVDPTPRLESGAAGGDALPAVLPATANLSGPFTPASDQSWLTITGTNYGVVSFSFAANIGPSRTAHITVLGQTIAVTQGAPSFVLGTDTRLEGPGMGSDSVVLAAIPTIANWTATTNAPWLHLSPAYQSGTGSTNLIFSYDANPGSTRTGTLTIAGQTLTVTQAGSTYVAADWLTNLVSAGLSDPVGVAVDGAGNVFFANAGTYGLDEWTVTNDTLTDVYGIYYPAGAAAGAGNVFFADSGSDAIFDFNLTNYGVSYVIYNGLNQPSDVAVDRAGNLYVADTGDAAIKKWTAASGSLTTLVSSGLISPTGVAVDAAGNVYIADSGTNVLYEWLAASGALNKLVPAAAGLSGPMSVAVDGAGNVYVADTGHNAIKEWIAASNSLTTLVSSGLSAPNGVAVDGGGNVYVADSGNNLIKELTHAFVDPSARMEGVSAGSDVLPVVLPATENLGVPFAPASDQPWLTVSGVANGVVSFAFSASSTNRTGHIEVLGQSTPITQTVSGNGPPLTLTGLTVLPNGAFRFSFTNSPAESFTVLSTTNLGLPLTNWTVAGTASNLGSGVFQFTTPPLTNYPQQFFRVRSP